MIEYKRKKTFYTIRKGLEIEKDQEEKERSPQPPQKRQRLDELYLNVGFYLVTPLILGVFLGLYIDTKFHTKPVFTLIGVFLGVVSTFYNLWKILKNN